MKPAGVAQRATNPGTSVVRVAGTWRPIGDGGSVIHIAPTALILSTGSRSRPRRPWRRRAPWRWRSCQRREAMYRLTDSAPLASGRATAKAIYPASRSGATIKIVTPSKPDGENTSPWQQPATRSRPGPTPAGMCGATRRTSPSPYHHLCFAHRRREEEPNAKSSDWR
ncbi:hypothetical protein KCP69_18655 [Salmonella enterica subsp. enterica]|nr:hypothetical protein KCP69_18655 [Salmonella enterica subsp. enterica]